MVRESLKAVFNYTYPSTPYIALQVISNFSFKEDTKTCYAEEKITKNDYNGDHQMISKLNTAYDAS